MKRLRKNSAPRISKESEKILHIATAAIGTSCRIEGRYWDAHLETLATQLLDAGNDAAIESALDVSYEKASDAHDLLAESVEAASETCFFDVDGLRYQALLISVPMIAWSKYPIAAGPLKSADVAPIHQHLRDFIFTEDSKSAINPFLYSIDHLPQSFSETRKLLQRLADSAMNNDALTTKASKIETIDMPADTRMLLAVVIAPLGKPMFRWQELSMPVGLASTKKSEKPASAKSALTKSASAKPSAKSAAKSVAKHVKDESTPNRTDCLALWAKHAKPDLAKLVPGASLELGLPDAFFRNCRECDSRVRPYMVSSAVEHLETALSTNASQLHAIIAGVGEAQVDEYRVALALKNSGEVVNGLIWPLVAQEDDDANPGPREQIEAILKASNVGKITKLLGILPPEFCEDCGAPLFYDAEAEAVHPHMPDDSNLAPAHYH